ncbi:MAG: alpha/beta hydrolase-fold protein [Planctomycetota bacterium]
MEPMFLGPAEKLTISWVDLNEGRLAVPDEAAPESRRPKLIQHEFESKAMNQTIQYSVYVPPGEFDDTRLPVIFVHDGEVALDAGRQAEILDSLIAAGKAKPVVAVFIRWRLYPLIGFEGYPQMFGQELIPAVQSAYPVSDRREDRASLGGGFGGTLALLSSLMNRPLIGRIGCHSPFAFELMHDPIKQLASMPGPEMNVRIERGEITIGRNG